MLQIFFDYHSQKLILKERITHDSVKFLFNKKELFFCQCQFNRKFGYSEVIPVR